MSSLDIYTRVSHKSDKRIISTQGQEARCRDRVTKVGATLGEVFTDPGKSAWNPKVYRPDWEAMMARLEQGQSDGVVVFDLARFARRPADGERLIAAAERGLTVLDSGSEYDLTTASGRKNFRDQMNANAYYSDMISESTRRGKQYKAAMGEVDKRRSFGFEDDGVTIREDEAAIIRECAQRLLAGETQQDLIRELQARGVPTVRGAKWGYTTFRQVMTRPRNAGYIVHNGAIVDGVRLPGAPILDQLTHDRIVALYAARKPGRPPSGRYVLTGLALCGQTECGALLAGRPVYGTTRRQYWCRGCYKTFVDAARLDEWAADWTISILADPQHADALAEQEKQQTERRAKLTAEQANIESTLTEIAGRLGRQEISLPRHDAICKPLEARLKEIASELAATAEPDTPEPPPPGMRRISPADQRYIGLLIEWDEGTTQDKRAMVTRALAGHKLVVGPGQAAKFDPARVTISK